MDPGIYNFTLYQGTNDGLTFTVTDDSVPLDLTGYTAEMKVRRSFEKPPIDGLTASTANGKITITPLLGKVAVAYEPNDTIPIRGFNEDGELECVYDIELTSPLDVVTRVLMGDVTISREVTRA